MAHKHTQGSRRFSCRHVHMRACAQGGGSISGSELARQVEALRWCAAELQQRAASARASAGGTGGGGSAADGAAVAAACEQVARKLEEVASETKESDVAMEFQPPPPAFQRYVAAVAAANEAAAAAASAAAGGGGGDSGSGGIAAAAAAAADEAAEAEEAAAAAWPWPSVCDNATLSFWRYCRSKVVRASLSRKLTRCVPGAGQGGAAGAGRCSVCREGAGVANVVWRVAGLQAGRLLCVVQRVRRCSQLSVAGIGLALGPGVGLGCGH